MWWLLESFTLLCSHNINLPFHQWDAERLALWLHSIGLGGYVGNCKRNVRSGQQLLNLSASELEKVGASHMVNQQCTACKSILQLLVINILTSVNCFVQELGMRNHFHVKKLVLALDEIKSNSNTEASRLDFKSVLSWVYMLIVSS